MEVPEVQVIQEVPLALTTEAIMSLLIHLNNIRRFDRYEVNEMQYIRDLKFAYNKLDEVFDILSKEYITLKKENERLKNELSFMVDEFNKKEN